MGKNSKISNKEVPLSGYADYNAKLDSDYFVSLARLETVKDDADKKLKAAYKLKNLPNFAKNVFRPFRETSDIIDLFEKNAVKISDKLKNKKITPEAAKVQMKSLLDQYLLRMKVKAEFWIEVDWIEAEKTRKLCQKTLKAQFEKEYKKTKQALIERSGIKNKKKTALAQLMGEITTAQMLDRIDYMLEAYLLRWYVNYKAAIFNLKPSKLKILKTHIKEGKFTSTNISEDLKLAHQEMNKAVDLWKKEGVMSTSVYKNDLWYSALYAFPRKQVDGKDRRYSPLPTGKTFAATSKVFPSGSKHLGASLAPKKPKKSKKPKKLTIVQKVESEFKGAAKSAFALLGSIKSYASKKAKSATSSSENIFKDAVKKLTKYRKEAAKKLSSGTADAAEVAKDLRKKTEKVAKRIDYRADVTKAYKATLKKADQLKEAAVENAKYTEGKVKEGYTKTAIKLGELKANAQAGMKKVKSREDIKKIKNKLEIAVALIASKFKDSAKPKMSAEKAPTTPLEKHVDSKLNFLVKWLDNKRKSSPGNPDHEMAKMYNKEYREGFNKLEKARAEYNAAVKETDSVKRKARLNKLNGLIDAQAKTAKISFPARLRTLPKRTLPKARKAPKTMLAKVPKPKPQTPEVQSAKPIVNKIEFKKEGQIDVVGKNLPNKKIQLHVSTLKVDLINNMKANSDKVNKITFSRDNMNQKIAESILSAIEDKALRTAVAKKLKDKSSELINVLKLSSIPKIEIVGRASMDGRFAYNQELADRRAEKAKEAIGNKFDGIIDFVAVGEVVDVFGKKITNMIKAWKEFAKDYGFIFEETVSVAQMKAIVKKYTASPGLIQDASKRAYLRKKLDHVRGVQLNVIKPKGSPKEITLNMKNQTTRTT